MERRAGIEPAALAWKARVLPLYERREMNGLNIQFIQKLCYIYRLLKSSFFMKKTSKNLLLVNLILTFVWKLMTRPNRFDHSFYSPFAFL